MKRKTSSNQLVDAYNNQTPDHQRKSVELLPSYIQTDKNAKFLASTIDKLVEVPQVERINGFVGSKLTATYNPETDNYLESTTELAKDYQLEPALVVKDDKGYITKSVSYDDFLNQIDYFGGNISNHNRILQPKTFTYNPHIDLDKFVNYNQYYWLEAGPDPIEILGPQKSTVSTYTVTDNTDGTNTWLLSPDGLTPNPILTFYRGMTYVFNVTSTHSFYIKTQATYGQEDQYEKVVNNGKKEGQVIVTVDDTTPPVLYYIAGDDTRVLGRINVKKLDQNTLLDVEKDIIGKKTYSSGNNVVFTNGLMVYFADNVTPESYRGRRFLVEGVGTSITLVDFDTLQNNISAANSLDTDFDVEPFDKFPFDDFTNAPITPEYVTISRASLDLNPWTRYNRWFHKDVITVAATANGVNPVYPVDQRAKRPIIEFEPNLKLYNFGTKAMPNVDLIDNTTGDAFSRVEKSAGYYVDGILLEEGYRVIFNVDQDPLVRGRVYTVKFEIIDGNQRINLEEDLNGIPYDLATIVSTKGTTYRGSSWYYDSTETKWVLAQEKTTLNQAPVFDLFDRDGISYSNITFYQGSFAGTRLFGYAEGTVYDSVLGLYLKYLNVANIGDYLFSNYFNTDTFIISNGSAGVNQSYPVSSGFLKNTLKNTFFNVWEETVQSDIPILQYTLVTSDTNNIEITAIDYAGWTKDLVVDVWKNDKKLILATDYNFVTEGQNTFVVFTYTLMPHDRVLFKIYTSRPANVEGYYEPSLALTNNPVNGPISQVTLAELSDHYKTICERWPDFTGSINGDNNFRDAGEICHYGTRLISHQHPLSFAQFFLGLKEYNLVPAIRKVGYDYFYYKNSFIRKTADIPLETAPSDAVDLILTELNLGKDVNFPYGYSDMLTYGKDYVERIYTIQDTKITTYPISSPFDTNNVNERAVLVYRNSDLLLLGQDYYFSAYDPSITFTTTLTIDDKIIIRDYSSTEGCYVPPTPTKLGIYPKYTPSIFIDDTYTTPTQVIQGHDGSLTVAFGDYRDLIVLEFEKRIYNNLKTTYNPNLIDIRESQPGAFRSKDFSYQELADVINSDFLKWAGNNGVDFTDNTANVDNPWTYNYRTGSVSAVTLPGHWRGIFKYFYDTDRPHTCPWEMLGFSEKPEYWDYQYGPGPYTAGNTLLWRDLRDGRIKGGSREGIDENYIRPTLLDILPVDDFGNLKDPIKIGFVQSLLLGNLSDNWQFGDHSPAETAWRRSSLWPFASQILMALTKPGAYASLMFDPARIKKSKAGQYSYGINEQLLKLLKLDSVILYRDVVDNVRQLGSGYSVMIIETGIQRSTNFLADMKSDILNVNYQLLYKAEGFISKDKTRIIIDSVDPTSTNPGSLLPAEDYQIVLSKSNPIFSFNISGIIIQKVGTNWVVKGYDNYRPYFTILNPIHTLQDKELRIGGQAEGYVTWTELKFYQTGQIVFYNDVFYRTKLSHTASNTFDATKFQQLPSLPIIGGLTLSQSINFETTETVVPYGTKFDSIQSVVDFILGYGKYLEGLGFVFDYIQEDFNEIINWNFSAREFMFWSTQNWTDGSLITLSPFSQKLKFSNTAGTGDPIYGVVDNIVNNMYEYSLLSADGTALQPEMIACSRLDDVFEISTLMPKVGLYFAQINLIQKQHAIVFNNYSMFNDIIYDVETGYRQRRAKLTGFRTANWSGGLSSPGFVFDEAVITEWQAFKDYFPGDVVRYNGKYYSPKSTEIFGSGDFNFNNWNQLPDKPQVNLIPNFEYKIGQFEDFYSLDIDNFDIAQQRMAQHLTGYSPRSYLDSIFNDPIAQYKFYQGYIREKGTANAITKIDKASVNQLKGEAKFNETWAFRIGHFGGYNSYQELEVKLDDSKFVQNPQTIKFVDYTPNVTDFIYYKPVSDILIKPEDYDYTQVFPANSIVYKDYIPQVPVAGYVRIDDVTATAYSKNSLLDLGNVDNIKDGTTFWLGFREDGEWDVLRYTKMPYRVIDFSIVVPGNTAQFMTSAPHGLSPGDIVAISRYKTEINKVYIVVKCPAPNTFIVNSSLSSVPFESAPYTTWAENVFYDAGDVVYYQGDYYKCTSAHTSTQELAFGRFIRLDSPPTIQFNLGQLFKFVSVRFKNFDDARSLNNFAHIDFGDKLWVDDDGYGKFAVYEKINNYSPKILTAGVNNPGMLYGFKVSLETTTSTFAVSYPGYRDINYGNGIVTVYEKTSKTVNDGQPSLSFRLNDLGNNDYYTSSLPSNFGFSLKYDKAEDLIFAGAPDASQIKPGTVSAGVRYSNPTSSAILSNYCGLVKVTKIYRPAQKDLTLGVLCSTTPTASGQFGYDIAVNTSSVNKVFLVGAPGEGVAGKVYVYNMGGSVLDAKINLAGRRFTTSTTVTLSSPNLQGGQQATARISAVTNYTNQELQDDPTLVNGQILEVVVTNPGYGYTSMPTVTFSNTNGLDADVEFDLGISTSTKSIFVNSQPILPSTIAVQGSKFGYSIAGDNDLTIVSVGAPGYLSKAGAVEIFKKVSGTYQRIQLIDKNTVGIKGIVSPGDNLGSKVTMSRDAEYLFVSAPGNQITGYQGFVSVWHWTGTAYTWLQNIFNPNKNANTVFGIDLSIDEDKQNLVITGLGDLYSQTVTFDNYSQKLYPQSNLATQRYVNDPTSDLRNLKTTFDGNSTKFVSVIANAGQVSIFNRYGTYFTYAQDLDSVLINENSNFGISVAQSNDDLYVSAPTATTAEGDNNGEILIFEKQDRTLNSWAIKRSQDDIIEINGLKKAFTIDVTNNKIQDYLSIIDPIKGKISGAADQELTYKTLFDPAVYSLGNAGVNVNSKTNWIDDQIGQLWWDLSAVKYVWYEQGELDYRKNNWGSIFPGSSINVYEWVRSEYLPSEWASIADTNEGLVKGISGQPKYPDNSVLSIKQVYNSLTQTFNNVYYYWVKNKVTVPTGMDRRLSSLGVAGLIADPKGQNVKAIYVLDQNSLALVNIKDTIQSTDVNLHLNIDTIVESTPRHTEWVLLQENDEFSTPPVLLEKKLIDSLAGFDSIGNTVPDTNLSPNQRYGIANRPLQSMFVDRFEALRNLITWTNSVLQENRITKLSKFINLNKYDEIPDIDLNDYDVLVEDNYVLSTIVTVGLSQAELACTITPDGKIDKVVVTNSGNGYNPIHPPTVEVQGTGKNAVIKTIVNSIGKVVEAYVVSPGSGYITIPNLVVRPYTVIVQSDAAANGFWTKFAWDQSIKDWIRVQTQKHDTRKFWKYIDWQDLTYNALQDYVTTVDQPYLLDTLLTTVNTGDYVKVKNSGDGNYMVLRKTSSGVVGTWDKNWDIIYEENGTIQILDKIWNQTLTDYAFDEIAAFDQTLFDQSINKEIVYLLTAIKEDLFVGTLKTYWNKFFFKAVKFALYEQQSIDWVFKTSFISVINNAGSLDQRSTYKLQDSAFYESWIEEVKPYHTKIRDFTVKYDYLEASGTAVSDFDLPPYFDTVNNEFITLTPASQQMLQYPYKAWFDNYKNFIQDIVVIDPGLNYITPPKVKIITAPNDLGTGAEAKAYISLGKVYEIVITNPGTGYTITPTVVLEGGLGINGTQARAAVHLGNSKTRANNLRIKFDRISYDSEIKSVDAVDKFTGDGSTYKFVLTWVPQPDRNTIKLTQAGTLVLNNKFTIEYYEEPFTNTSGLTYNKKYAKLVLNFVPVKDIGLTIEYKKSVEILNSIDRINSYYEPLPGMPGKEPDQLMSGLSYGGVKVDTLPFSYSSSWDTLKWWEGAWDAFSSESNYGVVKNPQQDLVGQINAASAKHQYDLDQITFWNNRISQFNSELSSTNPFIILGPGQYAPNPAYQYLLSQISAAYFQISYWNSLEQQDLYQYNLLSAGNIPVVTPFVVNTGTFINVYLNTGTGVNLRLDGGINNTGTFGISTIIGSGSTATVYVPNTLFSNNDNTVIFRDYNSDGTVLPADPDALDTVVDGGPLDNFLLGILPSDIVLDGYKFLDPVSSYAPEEVIPGQLQESIGISVFEQKLEASPVIVTRRYQLGGPPTYEMGVKTASTASVFVLTDARPLRYNVDFSVNPIANTVTLTRPISSATWISVTAMTVGGQNLVDYQIARDSGTTSTVFVSNVTLKSIKDAYVVVNGTEWTDFSIEAAPGRAKNKNPKGAVRVFHNAFGTKEIQVWMFDREHKAYSQVHEQIFTNVPINQDVFPLAQPPGVVLPHHSQVIVEWNNRRLLPPQVTYYVVEDGQLEYSVDLNDPLIAGQANLVTTEVYRNGEKLRPGIDFNMSPPPTKVVFGSETIKAGDALAIAVLYGHEYSIDGAAVVLNNVTRSVSDTMKVITFTNHDGSKIRKERYAANKAGKYVMSRPIVKTDYVWLEYNGKPLINELEYSVDDDLVTVTVRNDIYQSKTDKVVIMSVSDDSYSGALSYRMFTDILGRTSYKRLSSAATTRLAQPLLATDTKIYVEDASLLTPPNPTRNLPGIVYVAGERIEFFTIFENTLSQLRRGTLGTGILDGLPTGTYVIDQGKNQTLPVTDTTQIERFVSSTTTQIYTLTSITVTGNTTKLWVNPETESAEVLAKPLLSDMFEVSYGGVPLVKPTINNPIIITDTSVAYDSGQNDTLGNSSTSTVTPQFTMSSVIINNNEYPVLHFEFDLQPGVELFVSKRTGKIFEDTDVFTFLQETPGVLPEENYYAGDPIIILETGAVLTDESENPLEGI